jgi:hypothetical protein
MRHFVVVDAVSTRFQGGLRAGISDLSKGGTIDGQRGDHALLAPPYIVENDEIAETVTLLGEAVNAAASELRRLERASRSRPRGRKTNDLASARKMPEQVETELRFESLPSPPAG